MTRFTHSIFLFIIILAFFGCKENAAIISNHPNVGLTAKASIEIRQNLGNLPLLDSSVEKLKSEVDADMANGIQVPIPKDPAGGYTHNRHKQNYVTMQGAGALWQLTEDETYANYVKNMLLEYAKMYPTIGEHPVKKSYAPGKLFWQSLNEAVWMVYTSQAYDCIYDYLSEEDRNTIESKLLVPFADFLSVESTHVFNRVHNHGVWAVAAVGMAGFAMENEEMVERALYGVKTEDVTDNETAGFFVQLNELFSPDGYYTEGPYYQRYALLPYLLFAQAIDNNKPEVKIFEHRDGILRKAVLTTLQLTNTDGRFFPINDALKSMSYLAPELVNGVDIVYNVDPTNKALLDVAQQQNIIIISQAGLAVAKAIAAGETKPFIRNSKEFLDGPEGKQGAVGVLRSSPASEQSVVMKYASQGLGHGHFDRLGLAVYDNGQELIPDYGAARYVNVVYKHGGRYLPENDSWSKKSIAHNTVTVDGQSHFGGDWKLSQKTPGESWFFDASNSEIQIMSAKEKNAYPGVEMQRTIALIRDSSFFEHSLMVDIFCTYSSENHQYDLPYYYKGQLMNTNAIYKANNFTKNALGKTDGYQHIWNDAKGNLSTETTQFTWYNDRRFYTITSESTSKDELFLGTVGANDPEFSLRSERVYIQRKKGKNQQFINALEIHGDKHPTTEVVKNHAGNLAKIETLLSSVKYTIVKLTTVQNQELVLAICNANNSIDSKHSETISGKAYQWIGPYQLFK